MDALKNVSVPRVSFLFHKTLIFSWDTSLLRIMSGARFYIIIEFLFLIIDIFYFGKKNFHKKMDR